MTVASDNLTEQFSEARDLAGVDIQAREARWWYLEPGEPGYDQPLHTYLGMDERTWREYAVSDRRGRR